MSLNDLLTTADRLSNDSELPSRITEWAGHLWEALSDKEAAVKVCDLLLLEAITENEACGLSKLDHILACRGQ